METKEALFQTYRKFGITLQEFDYQSLIRAHLGDGPIPITPADEAKAAKFIERLTHYLNLSGEVFPEHYDYGKKIAVAGDDIEPLTRISTAPQLSLLLDLMCADGQSIDAAIEELNQMRELVAHLLTHLRGVKMQTDASVAGILSLQSKL
jgi:hypothetical protein